MLGLDKDTFAIVLAAASIVVAIIIAFCGYRYNSNVLKNTLRLDFSKRYQDLMTAKSEDPEFSEKYACLYFDLCSEEYRLHSREPGMIGKETWELWKEGMEWMLSEHPELKDYWEKKRENYTTRLKGERKSFQTFFDELVANQCGSREDDEGQRVHEDSKGVYR